MDDDDRALDSRDDADTWLDEQADRRRERERVERPRVRAQDGRQLQLPGME